MGSGAKLGEQDGHRRPQHGSQDDESNCRGSRGKARYILVVSRAHGVARFTNGAALCCMGTDDLQNRSASASKRGALQLARSGNDEVLAGLPPRMTHRSRPTSRRCRPSRRA